MSHSNYTPTTDDMRTSWHRNSMSYGPGERAAEFDRFIAKVEADALREAADGVIEIDGRRDDAAATWLNDRADRIDGEA